MAKRTRRLQRQVASVFRSQRKAFLGLFTQFKQRINDDAAAHVQEALSSSDWLPLWQAAAASTRDDFSRLLETAIMDALIFGGEQLFSSLQADEVELGISWNLQNPRALLYAQMHAAAQVTNIDDTTRTYLNTIISQAVDEGWSYTKLSGAISARFTEFATGGENPRSRRIAVYELGDAYEAGNEMAARRLIAAGLPLEKKWLTVGDDRVRPTHRENQIQGYIPFDNSFGSGDFRPPTDPGCRCVTLYRRRKTA